MNKPYFFTILITAIICITIVELGFGFFLIASLGMMLAIVLVAVLCSLV